MSRYFYTTVVLIAFICFVGASGAVAPPAIRKVDRKWDIVEIYGFVNADGCSLWLPAWAEYGEETNEHRWINFTTDDDYEEFIKYKNLFVKCKCYVTRRARKSETPPWHQHYIFIDLQQVTK